MKENGGRPKFQTMEAFERKYGIQFTVRHTGKMAGMVSLSTSPLDNPFCKARCKCPGSICQKCYAVRLNKRFHDLGQMLSRNYAALTKAVIPVDEMPVLNCRLFRFEAFGDVGSWKQVANYFNLCKRNPAVRFALWTKNYQIVEQAVAHGFTKPRNLVLIVSSPMIDDALRLEDYRLADKVFSVWSKNGAEHVKINCGGRSCLTCGRCYSKSGSKHVDELLK